MSDIYQRAASLAQNTTAQFYNNKGVLIVPGDTASSVVVYFYSQGGTRGDPATINTLADGAAFVVPVRVHSLGVIDSANCTVFELI